MSDQHYEPGQGEIQPLPLNSTMSYGGEEEVHPPACQGKKACSSNLVE